MPLPCGPTKAECVEGSLALPSTPMIELPLRRREPKVCRKSAWAAVELASVGACADMKRTSWK
eukprot:895925-Prorocentrum_lima.AAC.1